MEVLELSLIYLFIGTLKKMFEIGKLMRHLDLIHLPCLIKAIFFLRARSVVHTIGMKGVGRVGCKGLGQEALIG